MIKCSPQRATCKLQNNMCGKSARFLVSGFKPLLEESPNLGRVHTTPKEFENEGFARKKRIKCFPSRQTALEEFKNTTITGHFEIVTE